jgi:hypothetical protein
MSLSTSFNFSDRFRSLLCAPSLLSGDDAAASGVKAAKSAGLPKTKNRPCAGEGESSPRRTIAFSSEEPPIIEYARNGLERAAVSKQMSTVERRDERCARENIAA